jgi:hypothetical protein
LNPCSLLPFDISTLEPYNLQTILFISPFPAILTGRPKLNENKTTLSLAVATLANPVTHNPFACHSCKKHRGVGIPSECHPERSEGSAFSRLLSLLPRQSHHAKANPSIVFALFLALVTSHESPVTISFTIRTYEKPACKSRRIRTSKTQDLKPFRMNTSEKTPGGCPPPAIGAPPCSLHSRGTAHETSGFVMGGLFCLQLSTFNFQLSTFNFRLFKYNPGVLQGVA